METYAHQETIEGIFLVGSAARGTMDNLSDVDFYIIMREPHTTSRKSYKDTSGRTVEILFDTYKDVVGYLKDERGNLYRNVATMLADGKILHQTEGRMQRLQQSAQEVLASRTAYSADEMTMHIYSLTDFLSDAKRNLDNPIAFCINSQHFIENVVAFSFKKRHSYYKKPELMAKELAADEPELHGHLLAFTTSGDNTARLQHMKSMLRHISSTHPLSDTWEI